MVDRLGDGDVSLEVIASRWCGGGGRRFGAVLVVIGLDENASFGIAGCMLCVVGSSRPPFRQAIVSKECCLRP